MSITITNKRTGERINLSRDVATEHPAWVHEQCGTGGEEELQDFLSQYNVSDFYRGGEHLGDDVCGISVWEDGNAG